MVQNFLCVTSVSLLGVFVKAWSFECDCRRGVNSFQFTVTYFASYHLGIGCYWSDLIDFVMTLNAAILVIGHISIIH